ncbi:MAG: hypothetical protein IJX87_03105 [Clostridia bacterium]|nr:hypothetical protein [Clostridia bacterium]
MTKKIEEMRDAGIGGFIMHSRTGMNDEYLGEKWFSCIGVCLKKAKELGMNAWGYDENGWLGGFVSGKLLETESYKHTKNIIKVSPKVSGTNWLFFYRRATNYVG